MLDVPDYSKIFDKHYDDLKDAIIKYVKENLEGYPNTNASKYRDFEESVQDFFCSELRDILPEMHKERLALENEEVGDDEANGFWADCDEEWDSLMNDIIHTILEENKLA